MYTKINKIHLSQLNNALFCTGYVDFSEPYTQRQFDSALNILKIYASILVAYGKRENFIPTLPLAANVSKVFSKYILNADLLDQKINEMRSISRDLANKKHTTAFKLLKLIIHADGNLNLLTNASPYCFEKKDGFVINYLKEVLPNAKIQANLENPLI